MDAENIVNFGRKVCNETWGFFLNVQAIQHSTKVRLTRFTWFSEEGPLHNLVIIMKGEMKHLRFDTGLSKEGMVTRCGGGVFFFLKVQAHPHPLRLGMDSVDAENIANFRRKVCNETWGFFEGPDHTFRK